MQIENKCETTYPLISKIQLCKMSKFYRSVIQALCLQMTIIVLYTWKALLRVDLILNILTTVKFKNYIWIIKYTSVYMYF